ncbi:hypothetical protein [Deinococcus enclensis]|uniref:Uncharacterized protein n=1 Tax=Deinococcus enclensis TaxID=1049582 RepID=A0ABT9MG22_9DEIO|nr:hypothetical protein [Deinococcus enclensis]MDP9765134.1 hypothetical protein [Deinococcus enclensis]
MTKMDAPTKHLLLQQEYGGTQHVVGVDLLIPVSQALGFLQRLASLDIGSLYSILLGEPQPDGTLHVTHLTEFHDDRVLGLSQAAAVVQQRQASDDVFEFSYDVFDDIPASDRASILQQNPSISAQISADGQVEVAGVLGVQPVLDLIWHHVRLLSVSVDGGPALVLTDLVERFEQLQKATAWMGTVLTARPDARFHVRGTLQDYASPLSKDQWLLPASMRY